MAAWLKLLLILAAAVALAIIGTTPPSPVAADAPANDFSAERAMNDVRQIARAPHPSGSAENDRVRAYLVGRLGDLGLTVTTPRITLDDDAVAGLEAWLGKGRAPAEAVNVLGVLAGRDRSLPAVALMAHYDSVPGSPGASDDATGVAAILEILRAVNASGTPQRDIIVLLTDAEEAGLIGARGFFRDHPLSARIGAIVNMEARGGGGRVSLFETSQANGATVERFADAVKRPAGTSLSVFIYRVLPNNTDLTPALQKDYAAYNLAFIGRPGLYHSPFATPDRLDRGSLQDMGDQTLDLVRSLSGGEPLPAPMPDVVFFDVFGLFMVTYAPVFGWIMLAIGIGCYAGIAAGGASVRDLLRGLSAGIALPLLAAAALYGANLLSGAGGATNYYDRLAAIPRLEVQALLICSACFLVITGTCFGRRQIAAAVCVGAAVPLMLVTLLAKILAPTAAYPLVLTVLLTGIGMVGTFLFGGKAGRAAASVAAILVTGYMFMFGHQLFQAVGQDHPYVAALPLFAAAVSLWPAIAGQSLSRRLTFPIAAMLFLVALAIALWVRLDPVAASAAVYSLEGYVPGAD
jgi:hypothetical protein|tara:strand:- start:4791 stop:6521 length:1731 start_codon:yes stop_codon:yes gene_type:complete